RPLPAPGETAFHRFRHGVELIAVAAPELLPSGGIMGEPFAQAGARRDIADPFVELQRVLGDAARPDPVHEQPGALPGTRVVMNARDPDLLRAGHFPSPSSMRSSALTEWAKAAPARISAATQIASMISFGLAPARRAARTWPSMHHGHWVTCATATAISS